MRFARYLAASILLLCCCATTATAQIIVTHKVVDGKQVSCLQRPVETFRECGSTEARYIYIFIGLIAAVSPAPAVPELNEQDQEEVRIVPEEIFRGTPPNPITVKTIDALCGPKLTVGDRWLFYIMSGVTVNDSGPHFPPLPLLEMWDSGSGPVTETQDAIRLLRLQQSAGNLAILRGDIGRGTGFGQPPVPNVQVHATLASNRAETTVTTDADGHYEFPLLPAGGYEIAADPTGSFRPNSLPVSLTPGSCTKVTIPGLTSFDISGFVHYPDGSPVENAHVLVVSADNTWFTTMQTWVDGSYSLRNVEPGDYVMGVNPPSAPPWDPSTMESKGTKIPTASTYYPGVSTRPAAQVLTFGTTDRKGIDFVLPRR